MGRVRAVPRLCELYLDFCLTTEEKARKTHSQVSSRKKTDSCGLDIPPAGMIRSRNAMSTVK